MGRGTGGGGLENASLWLPTGRNGESWRKSGISEWSYRDILDDRIIGMFKLLRRTLARLSNFQWLRNHVMLQIAICICIPQGWLNGICLVWAIECIKARLWDRFLPIERNEAPKAQDPACHPWSPLFPLWPERASASTVFGSTSQWSICARSRNNRY